jgi:predicted GNAT family N-acyltransferase
MIYLTEPLDSSHKREEFSCGKTMLDNYIRKQARQDMKRRLSVVYVACDDKKRVQGYYTLCSDNIPQSEVPEDVRRKMPASYENLPTTLLGRLAVDRAIQGQKFGQRLLLDALYRSYEISQSVIGSVAVVVDPLDADALSFYNRYGFILLPDRGRMFLPMKTIAALF